MENLHVHFFFQVKARAIRIRPANGPNEPGPCLRLELFVCPTECPTPARPTEITQSPTIKTVPVTTEKVAEEIPKTT